MSKSSGWNSELRVARCSCGTSLKGGFTDSLHVNAYVSGIFGNRIHRNMEEMIVSQVLFENLSFF